MAKFLRIDFIFSYWIFAWAILFILRIVSISPKFVLLCGILENFILLLAMFYKQSSFYTFFRFIFINFWIKIIPLYLVWNTKITSKEIIYTLVLFLIYVIWLLMNGVDFYKVYKKIYSAYTPNGRENRSTVAYLYDKTYDYFTKL